MENCKEKIEKLEKELAELKNGCLTDRKFKVGDWVCFNHGEYPDYFSREVGQITHFSYEYSTKGIAQFKNAICGGWDDDCLRLAHPKEIEYAKSGLPFVYNKKMSKYELVEITGENFKIGDLIDTSKIDNYTGKQLITFLLETGFLNEDGNEYLSSIFGKLP